MIENIGLSIPALEALSEIERRKKANEGGKTNLAEEDDLFANSIVEVEEGIVLLTSRQFAENVRWTKKNRSWTNRPSKLVK
jgi:hypothetical protein